MGFYFYSFALCSVTNSHGIINTLLQQPSPLVKFPLLPSLVSACPGMKSLHINQSTGWKKMTLNLWAQMTTRLFVTPVTLGSRVCHWSWQKKAFIAPLWLCICICVNGTLSAIDLHLQLRMPARTSTIWRSCLCIGVPLAQHTVAGRAREHFSPHSSIWGPKLAFGFDKVAATLHSYFMPSFVLQEVYLNHGKSKRCVCRVLAFK